MKEFFIAAHMKLVEDYMLAHPGAGWDEAYEKTADLAYDQMQEDLAAMTDSLSDRAN